MNPAPRICPYCAHPFIELPHHARERLLPYCSHACRLAVTMADSVGGNRAHACQCSIDAMPPGGLERAMGFSGPAPDECSSVTDRGRFDLIVWLAESLGIRWAAVGGKHPRKVFSRAMARWPELREYFKGRGQRG